MYEHLVKKVTTKPAGEYLWFYWTSNTDINNHADRAYPELIGAIETWLAQPKPPTARERAQGVAAYLTDHGLLSNNHIRIDVAVEHITDAIEAAEAAARKGR